MSTPRTSLPDMSSRLPPPVAPPTDTQFTNGQAYQQPQPYSQHEQQGFNQQSYPMTNYPNAQQPSQGPYLQNASPPVKPIYKQSSPAVPPVVQNISHYHSKDSHREDNTYHPSLSPQQTAEALVESAVARHHTRVDVLFLKAVWGGILLS